MLEDTLLEILDRDIEIHHIHCFPSLRLWECTLRKALPEPIIGGRRYAVGYGFSKLSLSAALDLALDKVLSDPTTETITFQDPTCEPLTNQPAINLRQILSNLRSRPSADDLPLFKIKF